MWTLWLQQTNVKARILRPFLAQCDSKGSISSTRISPPALSYHASGLRFGVFTVVLFICTPHVAMYMHFLLCTNNHLPSFKAHKLAFGHLLPQYRGSNRQRASVLPVQSAPAANSVSISCEFVKKKSYRLRLQRVMSVYGRKIPSV